MSYNDIFLEGYFTNLTYVYFFANSSTVTIYRYTKQTYSIESVSMSAWLRGWEKGARQLYNLGMLSYCDVFATIMCPTCDTKLSFCWMHFTLSEWNLQIIKMLRYLFLQLHKPPNDTMVKLDEGACLRDSYVMRQVIHLSRFNIALKCCFFFVLINRTDIFLCF